MASTMVSLAYTVLERPWKSSGANNLQIANEAALYLLCGVMVFFCSLQTDSPSRLTVGRYFIAIFEVYLFGNTVYLARVALNHLRLVLKRRYLYNLRRRLAREVVSKMKLINQILFNMAEQAKEDKGTGGEQDEN